MSLIRTGPFNPAPLSASEVRFDYLKILLDELHERGLPYAPVAVSLGGDTEAPGFVPGAVGLQEVPPDRPGGDPGRTDLGPSGLRLANVQTDQFDSRGFLARSCAAVDATVRGKTFRFITTHLEPPGEPLDPALAAIQVAQANELLQGPSHTGLPVILVGDFNSNADGGGALDQTDTYDALVGAGFTGRLEPDSPRRPRLHLLPVGAAPEPRSGSQRADRPGALPRRRHGRGHGPGRRGPGRPDAGGLEPPVAVRPRRRGGDAANPQAVERGRDPGRRGRPGQAAERWAFDLAGVAAILRAQRREAETSHF